MKHWTGICVRLALLVACMILVGSCGGHDASFAPTSPQVPLPVLVWDQGSWDGFSWQ